MRFMLLSLLALCDCATTAASSAAAPPPEPAQPAYDANTVVLCQTTAADLERALGKPYRDGRLHRSHVLAFNVPHSGKAEVFLAVLVDASGVVRDIYYDVPGAAEWTPADQCPAQ